MLVAADADMAPPSHYAEAFRLRDGGLRGGGWMGKAGRVAGTRRRSCPGLTHHNIFSSPLFATVTLAFLDQQAS